MKQNFSALSISSMSEVRRMKHMLKRTPRLQLSMVGLSDALGLLYILWHWKHAACERQDGFIEVSGNPKRELHAVSEEAETWASLDLPIGQLSQAYLKFHQDFLS